MANRLCPPCVAAGQAVIGTRLYLRPRGVQSIYPYACKACWGKDARLAAHEVPSTFGETVTDA